MQLTVFIISSHKYDMYSQIPLIWMLMFVYQGWLEHDLFRG